MMADDVSPVAFRHHCRRNGRIANWMCVVGLVGAVGRGVTVEATPLPGITDYSPVVWSTKDGVFPGPFRAITQDRYGYIWLGISVDLVRFDGVRFVNWNALAHQPSLNAGIITALCAGRDGSLWVGYSPGGVSRIRDDAVTEYGEAHPFPAGRVTAIVETPDGTVWAASRGGLARFVRERWVVTGAEEALPGNAVVSDLMVGSRGDLFAATSRGVFVRRPGRAAFELLEASSVAVVALSEDRAGTIWVADRANGVRPLEGQPGSDRTGTLLSGVNGVRMLHDRAGNLWIATEGQGLLRVAAHAGDETRVEQLTKGEGLTSDVVQSLFEDRQGNIWVGTETGLTRLRQTNGITTAGVTASGRHRVTSTSDGSLWVGTNEGLYQLSQHARRRYTTEDGLPSNQITGLPFEPIGSLLVATAGGVARFSNGRFVPLELPAGVPFRSIDALAADPSGALWLCDTELGLMRVFHDSVEQYGGVPAVNNKRCLSLYVDGVSRIFIGFNDGSLAVYRDGTIEGYSVVDGLPGGSITAILRDKRGVIWVATSKGIAAFSQGKFNRIAQDGFPVAGVSAILEDTRGDLWFSLISGIVRVKGEDVHQLLDQRSSRLEYDFFDSTDGIGGLPLFRACPAAANAADGRLLFVTTTGVAIIDPGKLLGDRTPPPVRVEGVTVNGQHREPTNDLALPSLTSELRIDYTALSFSSPLKTRFRYMLKGFDRDWVEVGSRRQAIYTNLPPGHYQFRVIANDGGRQWSVASSDWPFSIQPHFYQTIWFMILCASVAAGGLRVAWILRMRHLRAQFALVSVERTRIAREIHDTLLQSLVGVALRFDVIQQTMDRSPAGAKDHLCRLRDDVQQYIREARQSIWNLRSPTLQAQDLTEALRETCSNVDGQGGRRCEFIIHGEPHRAEVRIEEHLLRIAREAVMNAVRHSEAETIVVSLGYTETDLTLAVTDDGCGFKPGSEIGTHGGHWGLLDMRARAQEAGGGFQLDTRPGGGTRVEVTLPFVAASTSRVSERP